MTVLVIASLVGGLVTAGCDTSLTAGGDWQSWDTIDGLLRPEVNPDEYEGALTDGVLRVVTFNVELGDDIDRVASAFAGDRELSRADIVLLQEIESYEDEGISRAEDLARRLRMNHVYAPSRAEGDGTHGLAILSRYPMTDVQVMRLPKFDGDIRPRLRIALAATIVIGNQRLRAVDVHLDVRLNIARRIEQLHPVVLSAEQQIVIAGDFNTNPYFWAGPIPIVADQVVTGSDQAEMLDDYMRAYGFDTPTSDSGPTQDSIVKELRLDAVYTRELSTAAMGVVTELELSDHAPLWVDLVLPRTP